MIVSEETANRIRPENSWPIGIVGKEPPYSPRRFVSCGPTPFNKMPLKKAQLNNYPQSKLQQRMTTDYLYTTVPCSHYSQLSISSSLISYFVFNTFAKNC